MAALATQSPSPSGTAPTYAAASAGGDSVESGEDVFVHVKNSDIAAHTMTVESPTPCNQGSTHNLVVAVPAGGERIVGPLPTPRFAQASTGRVNLTYDAVTGMTVAAIRA